MAGLWTAIIYSSIRCSYLAHFRARPSQIEKKRKKNPIPKNLEMELSRPNNKNLEVNAWKSNPALFSPSSKNKKNNPPRLQYILIFQEVTFCAQKSNKNYTFPYKEAFSKLKCFIIKCFKVLLRDFYNTHEYVVVSFLFLL